MPLWLMKLPPAADALADQKALDSDIQHGGNFHLMDFRHNDAAQQAADDAAVNAQAAFVLCTGSL